MLEVKHLTIRSKENQPLVQDISFSLIPGQPLGLTGASGSGKTTIIKAVMGILPYGCVIEEGEILLDGKSLERLPAQKRREYCGTVLGFIPQSPMTAFDPHMKIGAQMVQTFCLRLNLPRNKAQALAREQLQAVNLEDTERILSAFPNQLSGGMLQRVSIAFIHDANTEVKKRELFAKVRSGQVRVLMGSTAKMGAGTNVQDRLVALHDLDCPWRPRDLTQRKGRIERQGNQNKLVHVCRYVTEGTFDAYLWQTVENKQKFISQIMTSKSPVRSCEDVDATALSFAEIKALCAGDPRIKERMDLDIEVSKLKIMKADHNSKQFRLEDSLLKYFPEKIEEHKGFVRGLDADMQTLAAHPLPAEGFVSMEIRGDRLTDKENAGAALLDTCKEVKGKDPVQIGSYRGFTMSVAFDSMWKTYTLPDKGGVEQRFRL